MLKCTSEDRFVLLWLCAAALVTVLRFLHAAPMNYDLALQIQAAQNLLAGKGLSIYQPVAPDLAAPAKLITLTHFPSGYSLYAAALIAAGAGVGAVIKILAAATTLLGWWGWGKLAYPFFSEGFKRGGVWKWAASAIAISSPLLFTAGWDGTDIFMWAAVPWVLYWLTRASKENPRDGAWFDALAGGVCGLCVLMRYASAFLVVYATGLILLQSRLRLLVLTRRWVFFGVGLLPAFALQVFINYFLSNTRATPGGLSLKAGLGIIVQRVWDGALLLSTANYPWTFWFPGLALKLLFPEMRGGLPWQLGITLAIFVFLVLVVKTSSVDLRAASRDYRIAPLGLFVAFPLLLWGCMILGPYDYAADQRYYWPLLPLSVFVVYWVASRTNVLHKREFFTRTLQTSCVVYLAAYIAMSFAYIALFFVPGARGVIERGRLIASEPGLWPSMATVHEFSPARKFVMGLLKEQPDTLLLTSGKTWLFSWDSTVDRSRLHELTCGLQATYVSGPARIVFLTFDDGEPLDLWVHFRQVNGSLKRQRLDCFDRLPELKLLQRFPDEGIKILEAHVPANTRVILRP